MDHHDHGAHMQSSSDNPMAAHVHEMPINHSAHSVMDHMDHSGHMLGASPGMAVHHMMMMYFHGGYNETILFKAWTINTPSGLIGSIIGIIIMAALYEGLKYYREFLFWKSYNALQYRSVSMPQEKNVVNDENRVVHMVGEVIHKQPPTMLSWMHAFQTLLHIVQISLSYLLMLIFMTYNWWLCAGVVVGAAIGYFLFGWKKSVIVDVTEHCH